MSDNARTVLVLILLALVAFIGVPVAALLKTSAGAARRREAMRVRTAAV